MTYSVRNIVIALVLAAVAAGLVILYTGNVQKQAHDSQQNVTVVVAKSAIPAGSPVKRAHRHGRLRDAPGRPARRRAGRLHLDRLAQQASSRPRGPITAGSQITPSMFTEGTSAPITSQITGTMRAVQVAYNPNRVLDGTLKAGDHVDISWTCTIQSVAEQQPVHAAGRVAGADDERPGALDQGRRRRRDRAHGRLRHDRRRRLRRRHAGRGDHPRHPAGPDRGVQPCP